MLEKVLPKEIFEVLSTKVGLKGINEVRLRADKPIVLSIGAKRAFLGKNGATSNLSNALFANKIMIEDIIFRASECSIYSVNEQIKKGFIVMKGGYRLGLGGDLIEEKGVIKTMNNFSSINIRLPHEVKNCSLCAFNQILVGDQINNTLILSPPAAGKTTFLRDFVWQLSERNYAFNVLVLDERGELDLGGSLGNFADKISFASKQVGFENGIRSLSPNLIVTDEIGGSGDLDAIRYATRCGVSLLASAHASDMASFVKKPHFKELVEEKVFSRYVLLSLRNGPGTLEGIYNENLSRISALV